MRVMLGLFAFTVALIFLPSCRSTGKCPPGMVLIEGRVVPCGRSDNLVYVEVKSFCIDITEVTNETYEKFIKAGGYQEQEYWTTEGWEWKTANKVEAPLLWKEPGFSDPNQPVTGVHYHEAMAYAKWAGKRLPSEVEWELASRGTNARYYPWGGKFDALGANTADYWLARTGSYVQRKEDGSVEPDCAGPLSVMSMLDDRSPFGCYDMCGNVAEWCMISKKISQRDNQDSQQVAPVIRGGSWFVRGKYSTLVRRLCWPHAYRTDWMGFRCAFTYPVCVDGN